MLKGNVGKNYPFSLLIISVALQGTSSACLS